MDTETNEEISKNDSCPFCGAVKSSPYALEFRCGTTGINHQSQITWRRSDYCYRQQLAQQADLLRRALEVVRVIPHLRGQFGKAEEYSQAFFQSKALTPALEKALEEVK